MSDQPRRRHATSLPQVMDENSTQGALQTIMTSATSF